MRLCSRAEEQEVAVLGWLEEEQQSTEQEPVDEAEKECFRTEEDMFDEVALRRALQRQIFTGHDELPRNLTPLDD
jgi:hypothetical protein